MSYKIGINLGWTNGADDILLRYFEWIDICHKNKISIVRIFFVRWSINAIFDEKLLESFIKIVEYAKRYQIEIIPVLLHFTDFITHYDRELCDDTYTWKSFPIKTPSVGIFFQNINPLYLSRLFNILDILKAHENIKQIEIFNEPDLVPIPGKTMARWLSSLIDVFTERYGSRYLYNIGLADERYYRIFYDIFQQQKISISIDLHNYGVPTDFAFENFEIMSTKHGDSLSFMEYGRYSHQSNIDHPNSFQYFVSGIVWGIFHQQKTSPFHWWWNDLLEEKKYLDSIQKTILLSQMISKVELTPRDLIKIKNIFHQKKTDHHNRSPNIEKIFERLWGMLRNPFSIKHEFWPIIKFIRYTIYRLFKNKPVYHRVYKTPDGICVYIETKPSIKASVSINIGQYKKMVIMNMMTGKDTLFEKNNLEITLDIEGINIFMFYK